MDLRSKVQAGLRQVKCLLRTRATTCNTTSFVARDNSEVALRRNVPRDQSEPIDYYRGCFSQWPSCPTTCHRHVVHKCAITGTPASVVQGPQRARPQSRMITLFAISCTRHWFASCITKREYRGSSSTRPLSTTSVPERRNVNCATPDKDGKLAGKWRPRPRHEGQKRRKDVAEEQGSTRSC